MGVGDCEIDTVLAEILEQDPAPLDGCADAAKALEGCRLVWLTATPEEAAPLLGALRQRRRYEVATKMLVTGLLPRAGVGPADEGLRAVVAVGGCDKANTAHILTCLLQAISPRPGLVMQVGIAGAFQRDGDASPRPGDVVLATEEVYADSGSSSPRGWLSADDLGLPVGSGEGCASAIRFPVDEELARAAVAAVAGTGAFTGGPERVPGSRVFSGRFLTASRVTGLASEAALLVERWDPLAESMEGAAAAHMCALYGVPFLEVRGISNPIGDRDRDAWEIGWAIDAAGKAALAICAALRDSLAAAQATMSASVQKEGSA